VQLEITEDPSKNGRVTDQAPSPDSRVSTDDQVRLVVGQLSG
jgi:hypothetical protein